MRTATATIPPPLPHPTNPLVTTSPDLTTMGRHKKRQKKTGSTSRHKPSSPTSSISSIPAQNPKPSNNKRSRTVVDVADESKEEKDQGASDQDVETVASTENSKGVHQLTDEQELQKARQTHANRGSASYAYFDPLNWLMHSTNTAGECSPTLVKRVVPLYIGQPTRLPRQTYRSMWQAAVPQLCAIWCAQGARPFAALGEDAHRNILHPVVVKTLPKRRTVSNDIARLYTAVQAEFIETLRKHEGAMYLGLDAWQSPNGFDILGTVLYRLVDEGPGGFHLEAMPLDFVKLHQSHTGVYLAQTVQLIVEKFGVKEKICGIVTDNASNNKTMIEEIKSYKWPRFKGDIATVRKPPKETIDFYLDDEQDSDLDEEDPEDPDDQIRMFTEGGSGDEDEDEDDNDGGNDQNNVVSNLINDDEIELEDDDLNEMSDEGEDNQYTTQLCRESLAKFRAIARKLNKSPNAKALFKHICCDHECRRPHNISRDVRTRWNSTLEQLTSILRCSAAFQNDLALAQHLVEVLQPFYEITLKVSLEGAARIADIVVFIDEITSHLSSAISDKRDDYPPALRNACRAGLRLTNKYYTLTDCSPLYRVAMVLHPSFKDEYFKLAKWQPEWIEESIRLTRDMWETNYKPTAQLSTSQPADPSPKPVKGILAGLMGASEARGGNTPTDPIHMWLAGGLTLTDDGRPVNPIKWWMRQKRAGNSHGGLLRMALDVLSCPGECSDSSVMDK
ncbi:hypothetical protein PSHT_07742 [Puccinia striiformis]|uniref:DUF659 domain-containing protein n=1 Tax=Puccinia striiformis TaxID=27350 RepID=A0A2S4VVL4_9BASI|nr:hypothetical protein PSHT_07742 [Puccinia striiformis]